MPASNNNYNEQTKLERSGLVGSGVSRSVLNHGVCDTCEWIQREGGWREAQKLHSRCESLTYKREEETCGHEDMMQSGDHVSRPMAA